MYVFIMNTLGQKTIRKLPILQIVKLYFSVYVLVPQEERPLIKILF